MVPEASLVGLLGIGFVGTGVVRTVRGYREPTGTGTTIVGLVLLAVATAGTLVSNVPRWAVLSAVLATAGLVGVAGLVAGTLREDARLATAGYWTGCSFFAVPVVLVGRDVNTAVVGFVAALLLAAVYGELAKRTPARTVTVGSEESVRRSPPE